MMSAPQLPGINDASAVRFFSLARHALVEGLNSLGVGAGQSVLLPEYICRDLIASVHAVGATAVFYPVNVRLQPASDPADWPRADAVLAVDYFGFAQPLVPFKEYCSRTGARLIEDNAHGFLSRDESGFWLGTRGEVGLFSLRKTFLMINGAALSVQAEDAVARLAPQLASIPTAVVGSLRWRRTLRQITNSRKPELAIAQGVRWLRSRFLGYSIVPPAIDAETAIPDSPEPADDLFTELARQDFQVESERRRRLYSELMVCLEANGCQPVFQNLPEGAVPYGLPVFCDDPHVLGTIARKFGLDCFRWPDLPDAVAPSAPAHYRRLHVVNFL
jgi:hypothetical protein